MARRQDFSFGIDDTALAEYAGVGLDALHTDVEAICRAYEAGKALAARLGVTVPKPHLAGFCYAHVADLGCRTVYVKGSEPKVYPLIERADEVDALHEPERYLQSDVIRARLKVWGELKARYPETVNTVGHSLEGPVTTAMLVMGPGFLMLVYDDPARARRLLGFCVRSALNYARAITEYFGGELTPARVGIPDDFAGMLPPAAFKDFVVPYWEEVYRGLHATERYLHSELLRVEHLGFLEELGIEAYDPGADQYLSPEALKEHCPCAFQLNIQPWHIHDLSASELEAMYRKLAEAGPYRISFSISAMAEEPKIMHLLCVAREMQAE